MDERPHAIMVKLLAFLQQTAPDLKIASAINYAKEDGSADLYDTSVFLSHADSIDQEYLESRHRSGQKTTFYVCLSPAKPNTFPHSPPAESAWQGIHAAALNYSGFLRWAYCSWVEDPFLDTDHPAKGWPAGDCFLVYPGARTSIRFERLRDGIQAYEKIRLLRLRAAGSNNPEVVTARNELEAALRATTRQAAVRDGAADSVNRVQAAIEALSRNVVE